MNESEVVKVIQRWRDASQEKSQWHSLYDDLARVMLPRRLGFMSTQVEGERRTDDIFDGTPMQGARGLANAVGGMLRPEGRAWFHIAVDSDAVESTLEVRDWLAQVENILRRALDNPRARFRQAVGEADQDLVVLGTAIIFTGEGKRKNHLLFQDVPLVNATPMFDDEGAPEGLFRQRMFRVKHVAEMFGENALSDESRKKLVDKPDDKIAVLHAVLPRPGSREDAMLARNLPFASRWIEIEAKRELSEGGFHEFPFAVPRWDTSSGESMGRSPGMLALPDADTLQAMGETILIAGQRAADPPLGVPNDGAFDAINTFPGGLAYYDVETAAAIGRPPFFPIESGTNLPITRDMQHDARQQVFAAFFRNVLNLPVEGPQMTATEVIQRKEEFIREIGPVFGRLESDYTAPVIERAFMVMLRSGSFPPIPQALQGQNVRFEYESPVKRIRQQTEAAAARMWAQEMMALAQGGKPEALDLVNADELGRYGAEALGIPRAIVNSEETVQKIREARQQAAEAQAKQQQAAAALQSMDTAAGAMQKAGMTEEAA